MPATLSVLSAGLSPAALSAPPADPAVFGPAFLLAAWTFAVLIGLAISRVRAGLQGRVRAEDFAMGESPNVPVSVARFNRNYMNLLELPVLFYAITVISYLTGQTTNWVIGLAWAYVGLRIVHSLIHLSYNDVVQRLLVFATSNVVLSTIWLLVGLALFG